MEGRVGSGGFEGGGEGAGGGGVTPRVTGAAVSCWLQSDEAETLVFFAE